MAKLWKAIYSALFLTEQSAEVAKELGKRLAPTLENGFAHHLTLKFRPSEAEVEALPIGEQVVLTCIGYVADARACALVCEVPEGIEFINDAPPHITLCTGTDAEGKKIPPKASKEVLGEIEMKTFSPPILLVARVGAFNGKEDKFDFTGSVYE